MKYYINDTTTYIASDYGIIRCDFEDKPNTLFLSNLIVNENNRKQGYGTELINEAISYAKDHYCDTVSLEVDENEIWLLTWYKKLGFIIVGYGYMDNYLLMSKYIG